MFDIRLYKTNNLVNDMNKTLTNEIVCRGLWQDETSILKPTFKIQMNESVLVDYNYCYIPRFHRYYFIVDKMPFEGIYCLLSLDVDPIESWKNDIANSTQIIGRQEYDFNLYLPDNDIPTSNQEFHDYINFPSTPFKTSYSGDNQVYANDYIFSITVMNDSNYNQNQNEGE